MTTLPFAGAYYLPTICETHILELEELETSGEITEGKIRLAEIVEEYQLCGDCTELRGGK